MGIFDFFKGKNKNKDKDKDPSPEHIAFSTSIKTIIGETLKQYGFEFHRQEVDRWFTTIIYRNDKRYIKISGSTHWHDHPASYNIILGEGDSEDFYEYDWNSIALWRLKKTINPTLKAQEYSFPRDEKIRYSVENAKDELLKFGETFLNNDLTLFYETRKNQNKDREPYKIHLPDKEGKYQTSFEPKSVKQKKKYS